MKKINGSTEAGKKWVLSDIDECFRAALATDGKYPHVKAYDY